MIFVLAFIQVLFGAYSGYYVAGGSQDEHYVVAIMFIISLVISLGALFFGHILHVFLLYFIWLIVMVVVSEVIKLIQRKNWR